MTGAIAMHVNGASHRVRCGAATTLLEVLREQLDLTGAKPACGEGKCGACTVLVDGRAARACVTEAVAVAGRRVTTIEGLARGGRLHPVQRAFLDAGALQCGYCTPGMIMAATGLLRANARPTTAEVVAGMNGNICRCGCHPRVVAAIGAVAGATSEAVDGRA